MNKTHFYIGTSGWTYPHWNGHFYPRDLPKNQWLNYYALHFNAVEINATFYRSFPEKTFKHWYDEVPENFHYVVKGSRYITHRKYLYDVADSIKRCETSASWLKEKLGVILLQLPPNMPYDLDRLKQALKCFRHRSQVAVEFRNQHWFTTETRDLLESLNVIFCDIDSPKFTFQKWLTSQTAYIRLHGRSRLYASNYSHEELLEIADYARNLSKRGAKAVYIFFNNDYRAYATQNALDLQKMLFSHHPR